MAAKTKFGYEPVDVDLVVAPTPLTDQDRAMISEAIRKSKAALAKKAQTKKASGRRTRVTA